MSQSDLRICPEKLEAVLAQPIQKFLLIMEKYKRCNKTNAGKSCFSSTYQAKA